MLTIEENASYAGEFSFGNINGIGTFNFKDGRKYEGEWRNNKMHGYGKINWPDGKWFEGSFFEDKRKALESILLSIRFIAVCGKIQNLKEK